MNTLTRVVILTAFYFLGGILGRESSFLENTVSLVWPPSGIALAAILLFGYRFIPGIAIGALLVASLTVTPINFAIGTAIGSTAGAMVCAYLLQRFVHFRNSLERVRDVAGLVFLGAVMGTTVNAAFNAASLCIGGQEDWDDFSGVWVSWWVPNAMANLVVTPFILSWGAGRKLPFHVKTAVEAAICAGGLVIATLISFNSFYVQGIHSYPLAYLPYPFLVWASLQFGQRGATAGTLLVSSLAIHGLLNGRGPFVMGSERESLLLVGSYICILAITNMLLAAVATEREQAQEEVRDSERRYRAVVEDQTELIWRFRPDGTLTFVNDAYCRYYGKAERDLVGFSFMPLVPESDREILMLHFSGLTPESPVVTYDYRIMQGDGQVSWKSCTARAIYNDKREVVEYQAVGQDITKRKLAEESLRESEERVRTILQSMVDGILITDDVGVIESFNPAAEKILGYTSREMVGQNVRNLMHAESRVLYDDYVHNRHRQTETKTIELQALRRDGAIFPMDLAMSEMYLGNRRFFIAVVRDISARKQLEEQFRHAQKMDAVGRLAAGIAHDFNNLMQAIIGYCNLLLRRQPTLHYGRENVEQIEKAAERATALTSKLLSFSRKQVLQPKVLSLNTVVADMNKLLQRVIGADINLFTEAAPNLGMVKADPNELEQVILNLVINARDAMPTGGTLTISTANVNPKDNLALVQSGELQPAREYVLLSIKDTGCGMTPEVKAHLFEPFFTTKEPGKGTGLGLSIVYGIVKQSDGTIHVVSEPGKGTNFRIYLPRYHEAAAVESRPAVSTGSTRGSETILLVEDEEIVNAMLVEVLQSEGYTVLEAHSGNEAIAVAERFKGNIDLLVTDLMMPDISGRQLSEWMNERRPQIKVLYMSGYTSDDVVRQEIISTQATFLQKPFRPEALLLKVREMFHGEDKA